MKNLCLPSLQLCLYHVEETSSLVGLVTGNRTSCWEWTSYCKPHGREKRDSECAEGGITAKRARHEDTTLDADLPDSKVAEVLASITHPRKMLGPEVLFSENSARDEAAKVSEL